MRIREKWEGWELEEGGREKDYKVIRKKKLFLTWEKFMFQIKP